MKCATIWAIKLLILRPLVRIQPGAPYSHGDERLFGRKRLKPKYPRFPVGLADRLISLVDAETGERRLAGRFSRQSPTGLFPSTDGFVAMRSGEPEDAALFGPIERQLRHPRELPGD